MVVRFNRNILGCKVAYHQRCGQIVTDLIETYWDVKFIMLHKYGESYEDLIETYWDVKNSAASSTLSKGVDLIETYWDVKELV